MNRKILTIILAFASAMAVQAQTSNDNKRLKQALERFPAADTNKDGVLTLAEAFNYQRNSGKYYKLTLIETDDFLTGLGWLASKSTP